MADIFISYKREEQPAAKSLAAALEELGWSVWWDPKLRAGQRFDDVIEQALEEARAVIVLWSTRSVQSRYVRDEASHALDDDKLVPAFIEDGVKLPFRFRGIETRQLSGWDGSRSAAGFQRLVEDLTSILGEPTRQGASEVIERESPKRLESGKWERQLTRKRRAPTPETGKRARSPGDEAPKPDSGPSTQRSRRVAREPKEGSGATGRFEALLRQYLLRQYGADPKARVKAVQAFVKKEGDPRFRADAWSLPGDPLLGFLEVPAGPFQMGSDWERDPDELYDETPSHPLTLPAFYVGRWPVTVAQFRACVEDGGVAPVDRDGLGRVANHPVVRVSWKEALQYCAWLTTKLRAWPETPEPLARVLRGTGGGPAWQVTLPSEAEWEKAARGTDGRIYPWEGDADPNRANYDDTGIGGPSPVGCFPGGASPYGAEEMSGNVWEWTRSLYRPYPYDPTDGREDLNRDGRRVVRGGTFISYARYVRAASRNRNDPDYRDYNFGFRVVVSRFGPLISGASGL